MGGQMFFLFFLTTIAARERILPSFAVCNANNENQCWTKRNENGTQTCEYNQNAPEVCMNFKCNKNSIKAFLSYDLFSFSHFEDYGKRQLRQDIMFGKRALLINGQESTCM